MAALERMQAFSENTTAMIAFSSSVVAAIVLALPILFLAEKVDEWRKKKYKRGRKRKIETSASRRSEFEDAVDDSSLDLDSGEETQTDNTNATVSQAGLGTESEGVFILIECTNRGTQVSFCGGELTSKTNLRSDQATATSVINVQSKQQQPSAVFLPQEASGSEAMVAWSKEKDLDNTESDASTALLASPAGPRKKKAEGSKGLFFKDKKPADEICKVESFYYKRPVKEESVASSIDGFLPEISQGMQTSDLNFEVDRDCAFLEDDEVEVVAEAKPRTATGTANRYQPLASSNAIICPRVRAHSDVRENWCGCPPKEKASDKKVKPKAKTCTKKESLWSWW